MRTPARALACSFIAFGWAQAQNRGVYPLGMSATGSGVMPAAGFTYSNSFLFYSRNRSVDAEGGVLATGSNSVLMDMNGFVWASSKQVLGGARLAASATLPIANNSLASDVSGAISGGGGFADSYYQPVILGWATQRVELKAIYGFLAPTGRFEAGEDDNVGSGYWTHVVASGQTFYLTSGQENGHLGVPDVRVSRHAGEHRRSAGADASTSTIRPPGRSPCGRTCSYSWDWSATNSGRPRTRPGQR